MRALQPTNRRPAAERTVLLALVPGSGRSGGAEAEDEEAGAVVVCHLPVGGVRKGPSLIGPERHAILFGQVPGSILSPEEEGSVRMDEADEAKMKSQPLKKA